MHTGDGAYERAFASAVRANNGYDRALHNLKYDAVERLRVAIENIEVLDLQHQPTASAPR
jgi:hypothetical protein